MCYIKASFVCLLWYVPWMLACSHKRNGHRPHRECILWNVHDHSVFHFSCYFTVFAFEVQKSISSWILSVVTLYYQFTVLLLRMTNNPFSQALDTCQHKDHWPQTTVMSLKPFINLKGYVLVEQTASHNYLCYVYESIHKLKIYRPYRVNASELLCYVYIP
jgi:hypothetical protein